MRIIWSAPAAADLEAIHDYIARDSPHYASHFVQMSRAGRTRDVSWPYLGLTCESSDELGGKRLSTVET
jgi:plasmid stabilization system protein ParE